MYAQWKRHTKRYENIFVILFRLDPWKSTRHNLFHRFSNLLRCDSFLKNINLSDSFDSNSDK